MFTIFTIVLFTYGAIVWHLYALEHTIKEVVIIDTIMDDTSVEMMTKDNLMAEVARLTVELNKYKQHTASIMATINGQQ